MSEKVKLKVSRGVAEYLRPDVSNEVKLSACDAAEKMKLPDRMMLLFCLSKDSDLAVRERAVSYIENLPEVLVSEYLDSENPHPLVVITLLKLCKKFPDQTFVIEELLNQGDIPIGSDTTSKDEVIEEDKTDEDNEQFLSKYKMAQQMTIAEKIKMALTGDKEWRSIFIKDSNKLVSSGVIKNPRITDSEVLSIIKSANQNDEIMRLICSNKEWIKSYTIRKALIENSRTPIQNAIKYLATVTEKDLSYFAKSKNISSVISTMAKRILLNKKK